MGTHIIFYLIEFESLEVELEFEVWMGTHIIFYLIEFESLA